MKKIQLFVCEICGTQFSSEKEAERCEKHHRIPKSFVKSQYRCCNASADGYPDRIEIKFDDGKVLQYHR